MTFSHILDTNAVGSLIGPKARNIEEQMRRHDPAKLCLSVVTQAEVLFGLAKNPKATRVAHLMHAMMSRFHILTWTSTTASIYATTRADLARKGFTLGQLDMMIAAHALEADAVLVSNDRAFRNVPGLAVEDWTV